MVAAAAAKRAGKDQPISAAGQRSLDRDLAIRRSLCRRVGLAWNGGELGQQGVFGRIEITDPDIRHDAEQAGMAHAAVSGNEAAAAELLCQPAGHREGAAKQYGEGRSSHGNAHSAKDRGRKTKKTANRCDRSNLPKPSVSFRHRFRE
ncbi:hypothetical protein D3C71_1681170 [compost metagenome]